MFWLALILGFLALMALTGAAYQHIETEREAKLYPPPGRMIDVGGHRLHINIQGASPADKQVPTVVFDSGLGATSTSWRMVAPEIARHARVVTYDRAGVGWSDPSPLPRTARQNMNELRTLLQKAEVPPPYLFVAHSYGAYNCRLFTSLYPDEVTGLVMVDGIHPQEWLEPTEVEERSRRFGLRLCKRGERLARLGIARFYLEGVIAGLLGLTQPVFGIISSGATVVGKRIVEGLSKLPRDLQPVILSHWSRPSHFASTRSQMENIKESAQQVADAPPLKDLPIVALVPSNATARRLEASRAFAATSSHGQHIVVENSTHFIQLDNPEAVTSAIYGQLEIANSQ
jgi:pimeloyl-ACP methyl ester carboxylesterase